MKRSAWRSIVALIIIAVTVALFVYYFVSHPSIRQQLSQTTLQTIAIILGLYCLALGALTLNTIATLRLCRVKATLGDSLLLTAYTSVVNFFGPLQSGPAFRAVYVKKKYQLDLRRYASATLLYYVFYAIFSGLFLLSGILKWWTLISLPLLLLIASLLLRYQKSLQTRFNDMDLRGWYILAGTTLLHLCIVATIYYVELRSIQPGITLHQAIIYSGAANFALFVSLTPGAIGFRESFLVFSQRLHHISTPTIVAANILDRTLYFIFLGGLALLIFATHAKRHLLANQDRYDD